MKNLKGRMTGTDNILMEASLMNHVHDLLLTGFNQQLHFL